MYYFVDAYWKRGRRLDGNVFLLRHAMGPLEDPNGIEPLWTTDPACWSNWLDAVKMARRDGMPDAAFRMPRNLVAEPEASGENHSGRTDSDA